MIVDTRHQPLKQLVDDFKAAGFSQQARVNFRERYPQALWEVRTAEGVRAVPVNGSPALGAHLGYFETQLRDGTTGYFARRADDCVQASIATLTGIPMQQVPDLHLDKLILKYKGDLDKVESAGAALYKPFVVDNGLTIVQHEMPPRAAKRWIGIVRSNSTWAADHCLVMSGNDVLWDCAHVLPRGKDEHIGEVDPAQIDYGITVE